MSNCKKRVQSLKVKGENVVKSEVAAKKGFHGGLMAKKLYLQLRAASC